MHIRMERTLSKKQRLMEPIQTDLTHKLTQLIDCLKSHNSEYSAGAQMGRTIGSLLSGMFEREEGEAPQTPASNANDPLKSAEAIFNHFHPTLAVLGLELIQNRGAAESLALGIDSGSRNGSRISADQIELSITDGEKLLRYLRSLSVKSVESPSAKDALNFVAWTLDRELTTKFAVNIISGSNDGWEQLAQTVEEVSSELRRLGLQTAAARLSTHLECAWQGDLREFLIAEQENLLTRGGFGPGEWHLDCTAETYARDWNKALDTLELINSNEKALQLAQSIARFLGGCLDDASVYVSAKVESNSRSPDRYWQREGTGMLDTIAASRARIAMTGLLTEP